MDQRIHKINLLLTEYSQGKFDRRLEVSENQDDIDAFINAANMLGEEMKVTTISRDYLDDILNSVSDMVLVVDRGGQIETVNRAASRQLECTGPDLVGLSLFHLVDGGRAGFFTGILQELKAGKSTAQRECFFVSFSGKRIPVYITAAFLLRERRRRDSILFTVKDITAQLQSENLLLRAVIDTQEKERQRLAKDMHDSLGQQISAIKFYISAAAGSMQDEHYRDILLRSNDGLMKVLADMRNICYNLMPRTLQEFGLLKAVEELCNQPAYAGTIRFVINRSEGFPPLGIELEIDIFRVIQEFISNAINHGKATRIRMTFNTGRGGAKIALKDNGQGFDMQLMSTFRGRGLQNAQSRIKSHNGELKIHSSPGGGTEYQMQLPLPSGNSNHL